MTTYKHTIREVRAVVFASECFAPTPERAAMMCAAHHAMRLEHVSKLCGVEHIGPVIAGGPEEAHPFAQVLIGIACGAEIEWNPCAHSKGHAPAWQTDNAESVLRDIGSGAASPGEYRVKR